MNIEINLCLPVGILCRIPHSMPAGFFHAEKFLKTNIMLAFPFLCRSFPSGAMFLNAEAIVKSAEEKIKAQTV